MKRTSLGLGQSAKRTRRREFLGEMEQVVPCSSLMALSNLWMVRVKLAGSKAGVRLHTARKVPGTSSAMPVCGA